MQHFNENDYLSFAFKRWDYLQSDAGHLAQCPDCRRELQFLLSVLTAVADAEKAMWLPEPPGTVRDHLARELSPRSEAA